VAQVKIDISIQFSHESVNSYQCIHDNKIVL
jgi:hypothetical protein